MEQRSFVGEVLMVSETMNVANFWTEERTAKPLNIKKPYNIMLQLNQNGGKNKK